MKALTSSVYSFEKLRNEGYLYVDKTDFIWKLINPAGESYFLARPRRFGKSLLVSTLKAIFQGRRELFQGLAIDREDYDWRRYPVIHLDFGSAGVNDAAELDKHLKFILERAAQENGVSLSGEDNPIRFANLILELAKRDGQAVVLVDEYDKPILSNVANPAVAEILKELKAFYSVIKTCEGNIRFAFITGVSKFSHISLFSDLNNLTDITLNADYAGLTGFTEAEIRKYFADRIPMAAKANNLTEEELMQRLLQWYDGYRFSEAELHVCNPVSLTSFFYNNYRFSNYWESTGTPSFLIQLARERNFDYENALTAWYDEGIFAAYELDHLDVMGLLWQTGYLTIKEIRRDEDGTQFLLDFPDREVQATFNRHLIQSFAISDRQNEAWCFVMQFRRAIREDDLKAFMSLFQSFLACVNYDLHLPYEKYYQTIFFVVFKLLGASIEAESRTNQGRIDAYIKTARNVYLFEFKLDKTAEQALSQIASHRYYERFQNCGLPIHLIGVNFDSTKGRIDDWKESSLS